MSDAEAIPDGTPLRSGRAQADLSHSRARLVHPPEVVTTATLDLHGVRARDGMAMAAFFERYFDRLYALARHLTGSVHAAEDLTQETFLRVQRGSASLDPARDPWPWLVTIACNAFRDHQRSAIAQIERRSRSLEGAPAAAANLATSAATPVEGAMSREEIEQVRAALHELPGPARAAILMHDYANLTHEEVAAQTGATPAATRKAYSRAVHALGRMLARMRS